MRLLHRSKKTQRKSWLSATNWPEFWRVRASFKSHSFFRGQAIAEMRRKWCSENVRDGDWSSTPGGELFYFATLEDATLFKLKWEGFNDRPSA